MIYKFNIEQVYWKYYYWENFEKEELNDEHNQNKYS